MPTLRGSSSAPTGRWKTIRTYLGRVTRDIVRKIKADANLESAFTRPLMLARRVREQRQHQRGPKVHSLHAPEVEMHRQGKKPIALMSSASRCPSPRRCIAPRAVSSSPACQGAASAIPTTATRSPP